MHLRQEGSHFFNGERHQRQIDCAFREIVSRPCAETSVDPGQSPRSTATIMAHIDVAAGAGEPRPPLRDGSGYLNIQQLPWTVDREPWTVLTSDNVSRAPLQESGPWTVLTTSNVSRAPTQEPSGQSSVQTLEFGWKTAIFCNFWAPSARLPAGSPGSACRCSNMR
jgi:hypothetical protein